MKTFKVKLSGREVEIIQDVDGKFIKPSFLSDLESFGTALKPANEPIVVARKPLEKGLTIAENVVKWGTGALNIDVSRIGYAAGDTSSSLRPCRLRQDVSDKKDAIFGWENDSYKNNTEGAAQGRWPANVLLDEEAAEALDLQSGNLGSGGSKRNSKTSDIHGWTGKDNDRIKDKGGASRFFYVAKASARERGEGNIHPTIKPIKLMEYLIALVTPPNGIVLDPFMGSGSTGVAAVNLNRPFVGVELSPEYFEIAQRRIVSNE